MTKLNTPLSKTVERLLRVRPLAGIRRGSCWRFRLAPCPAYACCAGNFRLAVTLFAEATNREGRSGTFRLLARLQDEDAVRNFAERGGARLVDLDVWRIRPEAHAAMVSVSGDNMDHGAVRRCRRTSGCGRCSCRKNHELISANAAGRRTSMQIARKCAELRAVRSSVRAISG